MPIDSTQSTQERGKQNAKNNKHNETNNKMMLVFACAWRRQSKQCMTLLGPSDNDGSPQPRPRARSFFALQKQNAQSSATIPGIVTNRHRTEAEAQQSQGRKSIELSRLFQPTQLTTFDPPWPISKRWDPSTVPRGTVFFARFCRSIDHFTAKGTAHRRTGPRRLGA